MEKTSLGRGTEEGDLAVAWWTPTRKKRKIVPPAAPHTTCMKKNWKKSLRDLRSEIFWSKRKACEENLTNSVCVCSRRGNCGREINSKQ